MAGARLHESVGIAVDTVDRHPDGAIGAVGVLIPAPPERIGVKKDQDAMIHVERPALVAGQPGNFRGIFDKQAIQPSARHGGAGFGQPTVILAFAKS